MRRQQERCRLPDDGRVDTALTGTITFLFTDLEGSTRRWEQFPQAMPAALGRHDAILRTAIEGNGGTVVKTTGDGMMAVFGGAIGAATASLEAQRALIAEPWGETGPLRVRMGIHCGEAELRDGDYFGTTVNRAARIMAAGHGGQVLLSASAASLALELLPAGSALRDLGEHHLRDLGRPEHLYQLVHPDLPADFPRLVTARQPGADLPSRVAALIGRNEEIEQISTRLADGSVRLLTLVGPGGTGKTTLAIRVATDLAGRFRDGASFVDLSNAHDTNAVLVAVARAIGLGEIIDRPLQDELGRPPARAADAARARQPRAGHRSGRRRGQLLSDCPGLTVLATSREPLHVRAEQLFPVLPLALPPEDHGRVTAAAIRDVAAVRLFVDRAHVVRPEFEVTDDNAAAVAEICRRLDGLPLAIELAAARLRLFSPEVLRDRLDDRLNLLRSGPRDLPERQQTLRAAMDWSYELLSHGEQRLFEMLAAFASAEVTAIEAVIDEAGAADDGDLDVLDGLAGLVEKSLLRRVDTPGAEPRVAMLQTIREFAADRLDQRPDVASRVRRAHALYYADLARRLRADLMTGAREAALEALHADVGNLRIAWTHWVDAADLEHLDGLAKTLLALDDAHGWYLDTANLATDMLAVLSAAPASAERVNQEIALRITIARALMTTKGFTPEVEDTFVGALELFERGADVRLQFSVLSGLASLYMFRAQLDETARIGRQILAFGDAEQDDAIRIYGHLLIGSTLVNVDDLRGGLEHLDQAISLFPERPTATRTARVGADARVACLTTAAFALRLLGHLDQAAERADAALALASALDHPFTSAYAHFHAGVLRLWRREPAIALDLSTALLDLADEHEFRIWTATGSALHGAARVELGDVDAGLAEIEGGIGLYGDLRSPPIFWPFLLYVQAQALAIAGRPADGLRVLDDALRILEGSRVSNLPELHVLRGDLLRALAAGDARGAADAEPWYRQALEGATELGAGTVVLRAATRLAGLRVAAGDPAGASAVLIPIFAQFTEGFDTADLRDARELLEGAGSAGTTAAAD